MSDHLASVRPGYPEETLWGLAAPDRTPDIRREAPWALVHGIVDAVALILTPLLLAVWVSTSPGVAWNLGAMILVLTGLALTGSYGLTRLAVHEQLARVVGVSAVALMALGAGARLLPVDAVGGDAAIDFWVLAAALLSTGRGVVHGARYVARVRGGAGAPTLIVGAGVVGRRVARRLLDRPQHGLLPIGFLDKEPLDPARGDQGVRLPVLGASWDLEAVIAEHGVRRVVIAFSTAPHEVLLDIVRRCWAQGVEVMLVPRLYEVEGQRISVDHLGGLPLVSVSTSESRARAMLVKYAIDRLVAAVMLVAVSPLLGAIALAVRLSMGRPIVFRQRRVGLDGRPFDMLKFRTMRGAPDEHGEADAHWAALATGKPPVAAVAAAVAAVDRRTSVGRFLRAFSLDELPQLWNVARGDMSLVGPRPERIGYVERFQDVVYRYPDRHRVKAGLTGWAQVHGLRGETSLEDRIEWDNFYIENWSFWLDVRIMFMTLPALFTRRGG